ncbi:N-acetylmuramoyl-L-alanine amidase [Litorivicinus sp.]|nr:N-acetylmuramoyl-L-alanine amidase [Litorivicinus sp.]
MIRLFITCVACLVASFVQAVDLQSVRSSADQDGSRVVLEFSGKPQFSHFNLNNPARLVLDITNLTAKKLSPLDSIGDSRIQRLRSSVRGSGRRLVFDLSGEYRSNVFELGPKGRYPHRLVVDVVGYVAGEKASSRSAPPKETSEPLVEKRDIVVAIDPGHGGKDPGASSYGVVEKQVVLKIAKRVARRFEREPGYRAVLTREDDRYIQLKDRPRIAREAGADFFISIHADSFPKNRNVRGSGVYALSLRGANSELSRWLQNTENADDLAGGVDLGDVDNDTRQVLLNMSMESAIRISKQAGEGVLSDLQDAGRVHKKRLGLANFVVLRSPDIPSLLIETGFLSNRSDAKRLSISREQEKIAAAIFEGIKRYFEKSPPANTFVSWRKQNAGQRMIIEVRYGDTLSEIAARYGLSIQALKELNGLETNVIHLGQKLEVPVSSR